MGGMDVVGFMHLIFTTHIRRCHLPSAVQDCEDPENCAGRILLEERPDDWELMTLEELKQWSENR